jgi:hypothetical protein
MIQLCNSKWNLRKEVYTASTIEKMANHNTLSITSLTQLHKLGNVYTQLAINLCHEKTVINQTNIRMFAQANTKY